MCNNNMLELKKKMDVDGGRTINTTLVVGEHLHMTAGADVALCHKFTQCWLNRSPRDARIFKIGDCGDSPA